MRSSRTTRRLVGVPVLVAAMLFLPGAGCDLFATRKPDVSGVGTSVWLTPVTPQIIVENLASSFQGGVFSDYQRTMTEDFLFRPDETDVFNIEVIRPGEAVFENWNREVETTTAEAIFGSAESVGLVLGLMREELIADGRLLKYAYDLTLTAPGGDAVLYEGQAWFKVRQDVGSGEWFIFDWEDIASEEAPSWGFLKGSRRPAGS